jgi:hypothetical protein
VEFHTSTDCPFCGVHYTRLWWQGQKIIGIKHPYFEQDRECPGAVAIDPAHRRHVLVSNYERLMEHLRDEAYVRGREKHRQIIRDFLGKSTEGMPRRGHCSFCS